MAQDVPLKAILVLALLCGLAQQTSAAFVETAYTATLSGGQQVPFVGNIFNAGTAVCIYDRNAEPKILECEVQHNVPVATRCSIYRGAAGTVGPAVYTFTVLLSSNFRQTFRLKDFDGYTVDQQEDDFLNGNWYLSILSDDYPTGDIRGQLGHTDRIYTRLSYLFTIPRASGTTAHGLGLGTYSFNDPNRQIALDIVHDVQNPTSIDIHRGNRGEVGPQLYSLKVTSSPIFAHFDYTIGEEIEFLQDKHYIQVKSEKNPAGEIRGSAVVIDYIENVAFTSRLDESNVNPNSGSDATGCAIVTYNCETRVMEYLVFHNVEGATGAFVHAGSPGKNGAIRFSLSRAKSPIYGLVELNAEEEYLLYTNQLYFNIISAEFSSGEIRGQIGVEYEFYSYLSGTNVVPPVTTSSVGCATFKLSSSRSQIDYDIHHSVSDSVGASISLGNQGENGVSKLDFASTVSPITGRDFAINEQRLYDLINNNLYIQIESADHQDGEVRGQIRRINPCVVDNNSGLTLGSSAVAGSSQISASYVFSPRSSGGAGNTNSVSTANTNSVADSPNANNSPNASPNNSPSSNNSPGSTRQETTINNGLTSNSPAFNRFTTGYFDAPVSRIGASSQVSTANNNNSSDSARLIPGLFVALVALLVLLF